MKGKIERKKEQFKSELELTEKTENAIFCELVGLQKILFKHMLTLPEYQIMTKANIPCDCGVNNRFFDDVRRIGDDKKKAKRCVGE